MAEPFLSEIRLMSFWFPPKGWALCNGQFLPINQNQALFSLLGTTYGGNGQTTFALPDLRGKVPLHFGNGFTLGQTAGAEATTLNITQLPAHIHPVNANDGAAAIATPGPTTYLAGQSANPYGKGPATLPGPTLSNVGGSQPHTNMQPYLTINFCIALQGIFPSQS